MANPRNGKVWSVSRVAGIGAALALVATAMTTAPASADGGTSPATVTLSSSAPGIGPVTGEAVAFTATVTASAWTGDRIHRLLRGRFRHQRPHL